jgi:hypothetical protein
MRLSYRDLSLAKPRSDARYASDVAGYHVGDRETEELFMADRRGTEIVDRWPDEAKEAAQLVLDRYGEPDEATESFLVWHRVGPWKRIIASKTFWRHEFPVPHYDSIEGVVDFHVPPENCTALAQFDGSVVVERTAGEISARCHDEEANNLALNLAHDIVVNGRSVEDERAYYAKEFLDHRRKQPTPYMDGLRFEPRRDTPDPDTRVLSDEELAEAEAAGRAVAARR